MGRERGSQGQEQGQNMNGMRDVWCWALSWYLKPPQNREKRIKQSQCVEAIKQELKSITSVQELHNCYTQDSKWCLQIARELYPRDWPSLGVHATSAAAYGLRYVELMVNKPLNAKETLPKWVGEWAIW